MFKKNFLKLTDFLFIFLFLYLGYKLYVQPVGLNPGKMILFSDDAIYAILARKVLEVGGSGAFHLTWSPLFPWLMAALSKYFRVAIEDSGMLISAWSLLLRIIPGYLIARILFGRVTALISVAILAGAPLLKTSLELPTAETLFSLIFLWGAYFSIKALQSQKHTWYLLSGLVWGLAYLTRPEGWVFIIPLVLLTLIRLIYERNVFFKVIRLIGISAFGFLIISYPYLSFIREAYGSWTLNPRWGIHVTTPPPYTLYQDINGATTPGQAFWSGESSTYSSALWHPKPKDVVLVISRTLPDAIVKLSGDYLAELWRQIPGILVIGFLGILLSLIPILKKNFSFLIITLSLIILTYIFIDFLSMTLAFFLSRSKTTISDLLYLFVYDRFPPSKTLAEFFILFLAGIILLNKDLLLNYLKVSFRYRAIIFLFLSLLIGVTPSLFFNAAQLRYLIWAASILTIYTSFTIYFASSLIKKLLAKTYLKKNAAFFSVTLGSFLTIWLAKPLYSRSTFTQDVSYYILEDEIARKLPGEAILKDGGPGKKVAAFHEGIAFYAHGKIFYIPYGTGINFEITNKYLNDNKVEYLVALKYGAFEHENLKPFYDSESKIAGWKIIYIDPPRKTNLKYKDNLTVTVWKKV